MSAPGSHTGTSSSHSSATSSSGSASGSVGAPAPVKGKPASVTVLASGDVIAQPVMVTAAKAAAGGKGYDFTKFLNPLSSTVAKGDVKICQMESPLSPDNTNLTLMDLNVPSFNGPHEMAEAVKKVGFDGCSTANNHAYDRKLSGLVNTRTVMDRTGLKASGPGASEDKPGDPVYYEAKGLKIAQLSYSYTLDNRLNGDQTGAPAKAPWVKSNLYSARTPEGIEADAAAARKNGADIVVVSMHWGIEYQNVSAEQKKYAQALLSSGQVDWIIGNHPHIVQACEKIDGRYVNYALGNTMSSQQPGYWLSKTGHHVDDGAIAAVTFTRGEDGKISQSMSYQPTHQEYSDHIVRPASAGSDAFKRVSTTMTSMGCDAQPMK